MHPNHGRMGMTGERIPARLQQELRFQEGKNPGCSKEKVGWNIRSQREILIKRGKKCRQE